MVPMSELTTNFARVPNPTVVLKKWLAFPITFKPLFSISSNKSLDPAQRKISVPVAAGPLEPETGASKNRLFLAQIQIEQSSISFS